MPYQRMPGPWPMQAARGCGISILVLIFGAYELVKWGIDMLKGLRV